MAELTEQRLSLVQRRVDECADLSKNTLIAGFLLKELLGAARERDALAAQIGVLREALNSNREILTSAQYRIIDWTTGVNKELLEEVKTQIDVCARALSTPPPAALEALRREIEKWKDKFHSAHENSMFWHRRWNMLSEELQDEIDEQIAAEDALAPKAPDNT